jgi:hypothetical protein
MAKKTRFDICGSYQQKKSAVVKASYLVAQGNAKVKRPHTTA